MKSTKFVLVEIEDCECGHEAPTGFIVYDSQGIGTCMPCVLKEFTYQFKKARKRKANKK